MRPEIENVKPLEKYKLFVRFADGTQGVLDLRDLKGKGVFQCWEEGDTFFRVFVSGETGAITWPPDIDIDTYNVYCELKDISPDEYFKSTTAHAAN